MENSLVKSGLKKLEFPNATPSRHNLQSELQSTQKQRYDIQTKQFQPNLINTSQHILSTNDYCIPTLTFPLSQLLHLDLNQKEIYVNSFPIKMKGHDREEFQTMLLFKMSLINPNHTHSQILHLEITEPINHLFLYVMDINEAEFFSLKTEQSILVDFQAFPSKLAEILEKCLSVSMKDERIGFNLVLETKQTGEALLNVIESNQFKALCHLSLRFREATDHILKQHLAHRLTVERAQNEELRIHNERLEHALSAKSHDYDQALTELRKFQEKSDQKIEQVLLEKQRELTDMTKESFEKEKALSIGYDNEFKKLTESHQKTLNELNQKLDTTSENLKVQTEKRINLESVERELSNKVKGFEREISLMEAELKDVRAKNMQLDSMRFSNEKQIAELTAKCKGLEANIEGKEQLLLKQTEIADNGTAQRTSLEENIAEYKKRIEKLEQKCAVCSEEINKGNEIIEKLQGDIANQKQKLKTKNSLVLQQEQSINEHLDQIERLSKQVSEFNRENESKELKLRDQEILINDLRMKIQESQKTLESNQTMIQYLNKCLNDNPRGAVRVPFTSNKYTSFGQNGLGNDDLQSKYSYSGAYDRAQRNSSLGGNEYGAANNSGAHWNLSKSGTGYGIGASAGGLLDKSPIKRDYERELTVPISTNKENLDFGNTGRTSEINPTRYTAFKNTGNNEFTSSSIDMSPYVGPVQPIKYKDPSAK